MHTTVRGSLQASLEEHGRGGHKASHGSTKGRSKAGGRSPAEIVAARVVAKRVERAVVSLEDHIIMQHAA